MSFDFSIKIIERFNDMSRYEQKAAQLALLPKGSLGKCIADCLKENSLRLVPGFENHDLKHVVLDYKMTPVDEIRMQAFMLGNGNITFPSIIIFLFGAILLPSKWNIFIADYKKGAKTAAIASWTIEEYATVPLNDLRKMLLVRTEKQQDIKRIPRFGAYTAMTAGVLGMFFCLPFLFSSSMADLVGAGFPFVGGAILAAGGLVSLSNLAKA